MTTSSSSPSSTCSEPVSATDSLSATDRNGVSQQQDTGEISSLAEEGRLSTYALFEQEDNGNDQDQNHDEDADEDDDDEEDRRNEEDPVHAIADGMGNNDSFLRGNTTSMTMTNDDDRPRTPYGNRCVRCTLTDRCAAVVLLTIILAIAAPVALLNARNEPSNEVNWRHEITRYEALQEIAVDSGHACAIRSNFDYDDAESPVLCWGQQVGVPANLRRVQQVVVGDGFSCAIATTTTTAPISSTANENDTATATATAEVVCWGADGHAEDVQPPTDLGPVSRLVASGDWVCALTIPRNDDGDDAVDASTVAPSSSSSSVIQTAGWCWGGNLLGGQRGAVRLPALGGERQQYAELVAPKGSRLRRVCAIGVMDRQVDCWKLEGTTSASASTSASTSTSTKWAFVEANSLPTDLGPVAAMAMMRNFVCAIRRQSTRLQCWAYDDDDDDDNTIEVPLVVPDVMDVSPGHDNLFCVIETNGRPHCYDGQRFDSPRAIGVVTKIQSDKNGIHCAIRRQDQFGVCWGINAARGQLAPLDSNTDSSGTSGTIFPYYGEYVATGSRRTCASQPFRPQVDCWGELGYRLAVDASSIAIGSLVTCLVDNFDNDAAKCIIQDQVFTLHESGPVSQVTVTAEDTICAVSRSDGSVRCYQVECKRPAQYPNYPNYRSVVECVGISNFTGNPQEAIGANIDYLAMGDDHSCGIRRETKRLDCWPGAESTTVLDNGQAGVPAAAQVPDDLLPVIDVAVGRYFTCAIQETNEIACWGNATEYGMNGGALTPPPGRYYQAIAATQHEVCAITLDDFVHCWGRPFSTALYIPSTLNQVQKIDGGLDHFCAIQKNTLEVVCWGSNRNGELSLNYFT